MSLFDFLNCTYAYEGIENVAAGYSAYHYERESVHEKCFPKDSKKICAWEKNNQFFIFIHMDTREIIGVRTIHGERVCPWDVLFFRNYVPVSCHRDILPPFSSADKINAAANGVLDRFLREVEDMFCFTDSTPAMPLFLTERYGENNYCAWSLQEGKYVVVSDYESYHQSFNVWDDIDNTSPASSEGRYVIIPPSDELIKGLGLPIDSAVFGKKSPWDRWEPRTPISGQNDIIPKEFRTRYAICIETLNRSFAKDLGHDVEFYQLEMRVHRLERFCQLQSPKKCISDEMALIEKVLPALENLR